MVVEVEVEVDVEVEVEVVEVEEVEVVWFSSHFVVLVFLTHLPIFKAAESRQHQRLTADRERKRVGERKGMDVKGKNRRSSSKEGMKLGKVARWLVEWVITIFLLFHKIFFSSSSYWYPWMRVCMDWWDLWFRVHLCGIYLARVLCFFLCCFCFWGFEDGGVRRGQ